MNSINNFMEVFDRKRMDKAWTELTLVLKESNQYFQNIPKSERGRVLSILFDERKGLLTFLTGAIDQPDVKKALEGTIIQAFHLLTFLIIEFGDVYDPYIKATQTVCKLAVTIKAAYYVKSAASKTFIELIKTFQASDLDFGTTITEWMKKSHLYTPAERRIIFEIISHIARYFPQTAALARYAKTIRHQLNSDIVQTYEAVSAKNLSGLSKNIEALNNMLHNFPPSDEDADTFGGREALYKNLKKLCTPKEHETSKQLVAAIMDLFSEHLIIFDEFVYSDYEFWHVLFRSFVNKGLYGDRGIKVLKIYYKTMGTVIGRKNSEDDKKIFLYLRDSFVKSLSDGRLSSAELRLTVYGFSQIIEPCKNYFAEAGVEDMFSLIAHRTIPLYAREDDEAARFEEIADYQEALSRIIRYLSNVSIDQIRALTTLCSILIKRFPELSIADQQYAASSLNRTIVNVRYTKEILYQDFISHIIYDGIVWSCSHMLLIDAELKRDVDDSPKRPITYKDYVPLWQDLLNPENYASTHQNSDVCAAALQRVVDEIIATCIALMKTLNLNVKSKENNVFSDVKVSQTVENESDFRIFLNLVDLYVEILANVENFLWSNILQKFLYEIIKNSYKNPLISGFYKLVNAVLMASGAFQSADSHSSNSECFNLVLQYLWNTLDAVTQYPQELQISCLQLVLNVPENFVRRIVDRAVPAFKISFTLGLTNYEVATIALSALERWTKCLGSDCPKDFVGELVPCLELYLQSEESSILLLQDIEETKRNVKKVTLLDDEQTVEAFQKRILLFFGSLENDVMLEFIHRRSLNTGATWSKKDLLKYPMPFPDMDLNINLDSMLPRIIELALNSGDRRTRVAASEVLHTIVAFMLGKTVQFFMSDTDRFTPLYETLCPALLRLGCDSDDVIMQLYHPLMMQITHWLSSHLMLNSRATIYLVDSLFDGLSDETNSSLRDVSGIYLAEFVQWSIKQSTDKNFARRPININLIVQRIMNFALDPSSRKRVAAAIAFNHLYKILRENEEIVNIFWFDILHAFVKSLDGCKDSRIHDAIRHVERVLVEKAQIFNEVSARRRRPPGFCDVRLQDAAKWILTQCGSLDRNCRKKCFDLFESVSRSVDGCGTAKSVISAYLETDELQGLNEIVIGDLEEKFKPVSTEGFDIFLRTLDLYIWLIREKLIDNEILFSDVNQKKNVVFNCIEKFVVSTLVTALRMVENDAALRLQEFVRLKTLRCEIIITLFDFIPVLLEVKTAHNDFVPDCVFCDALFSLVSVCLMRPRRIGFDSSNLQLTEELPAKIEALLNSATRSLSEALKDMMKHVFATNIKRFSDKLFKLEEIVRNEVVVSDKNVRGLILLHKCRILKLCDGCSEITANADTKIINIFDILKTEDMGRAVCFYPKPEVKNYLQRLVELLLTEYDIDTMKTVVQLLMNSAELRRSDLTIVTHGEYFLSFFKDVVIQGCLRDVEKTLNLLVKSIQENPDNVLRITEALILYLQRNRTEYQDILDKTVDLVLEKFVVLERAVNNLEHRRDVFLNIYAVVVRLKRTPLDVIARRGEIYRWILRELVACNKFKYKIRLLRDFLICMTNESSDDNPELMAILYNLKNERRIVTSPDDPSAAKIASPETIDCFQTLLKLLPITKSSVVFDAVINFAMGAGKLLCEDKVTEYLKLYYAGISAASVLKSLELSYKRFMNTSSTNDRCDVLLYFLLPSFGNCSPQTMENFFERNTKEIYATIMQKPTENLDDRQQLFVSKIGCYNLVEIMFANLPRDRIDCKDSPITISTIGATNSEDKFSKRIFRSTLPIRQLRSIEGDNREIVRLVHCAAYNCCIAIVSMTKDERFYLAAFGENREKNQLIWENIVDTRRQYELRQTSKEYPKERKKLVNIRKSAKEKRNPDDHYSYIKSYDLATSTLSENICAYDLNAVNVIPRAGAVHRANETMSLTLEVDDLNDHECMAPICGLLIHMLNNEISRPQCGESARTLPKWMSEFRRSMSSEHVNVRLFTLKIILNTQAVFKPYAGFFLEPIITTIYQSLKDGLLNYVITDALVMLVDWQEVAVPNGEKCKKLAQLLLIFLVERGSAAPTKYIVRYNMSILEMIVDAWHECLSIPVGLTHRMTQNVHIAVRLVLIFLTNKMAKQVTERNDIWEYLHKSMVDWKNKEEPVLQTYEAVGLLLKYSESMEDFDERKNRIMEIARSVFRQMQLMNPGILVKCVYALCKAYPKLTEEFYQFVSSSQLRVERANMVKCLQVFSLMIPELSEDDIAKELNYMQFNSLLENKVLSCEKKCLEIIKQLVPLLGPSKLSPLVELVSRYSEHEVLEYRSICYDVFTALYKKYSTGNSREPEVKAMMDASKRILLTGLLDPAESIQQSAVEFWSEIMNVGNKCSERLLDILDTYTSGIEKNFLQIMTLMLLQLTKKSISYEKKMFEPLHNCSYHDHAISVSWKSRNFESRIPLFAPSLASRMNQRLTQYSYAMGSSSSSYGESSQDGLMLRATEAPQFEATFLGEASMSERTPEDMTEEGIFAVPKVPELSKNKVSRRFLADWSDINSSIMKKQAATRFAEQEYRREYLARKRSSVKLYRKYRIGDFPDIEISHATVLGPMQELVKKDPIICKNLIVSLIRSLIDQMADSHENDRYCVSLSEKLTRILKKRRRNGAVIPAIFEIMFNVRELVFPWEVVTEVARADGLFAQGALLTERSLIYGIEGSQPPTKRPRVANPGSQNSTIDRWIELAGLYESMDEVDVVLSIFKGEMFSEDLHVASAARAAADWDTAENSYIQAFESESGSKIKRHCLQGMFECLSRLTKWKKLESAIETRVQPNFETLLDADNAEGAWIAPWIFRAHTHRILDGKGNDTFVNALQSYVQNAAKCQSLKELFGEETAVILINERPEVSRDFLNGSCDKIRENWIQLSPLAVPLRSRAVVKLRGIHDIDSYLKTVESPDILESSRVLLNYWQNSVPSIHDDLLSWDNHLSYRSYFSSNLIDKLTHSESQEGNDIANKFRSVRAQQMLKLVECALNQKNRHVAKKYLCRVEPELDYCGQNLVDNFDLNAVRFKFLTAEMLKEPDLSLRQYALSWQKAHEILNNNYLSTSSEVILREIISTMASSLGRIATNCPAFFDALTSQSSIIRDIFTERIDFENVTDSLNFYSFSNLKRCCIIAAETGECHLRLAKYCYENMSTHGGDSGLSREFVRATLRAMTCGSEEATHYFPCLLKEEFLSDEETREIFREESSKVETWRFLIWQTQLLSHLGSSIGSFVLPIVKRMIKTYPNALAYSLRLTLDTKPQLRDDPSILPLTDLLADKQEFNKFLEAMQYVVQPELYLEYHLKELLRNLSRGRATVVDALMKKVYPTTAVGDQTSAIQGEIYRKTIASYKQEIEKIIEMPVENIGPRVVALLNRLKHALTKRKDKIELKDYSPWLHEFVGRDIEVPGQYTGEKKPMPRYHAKIVKIESVVRVMKSARRPIRITIVANDAKNYRFLVKFGEDLRLDQRVEQIFDVMNKTLKSDYACSQRRLSVDTYQVFPLSGSLGFIQWIDGTKTLMDYINFSLDDNKKRQHHLVEREYEEWIVNVAPGRGSSTQYKEALKYPAEEVKAKMNELTNKIGWDLLRQTFVMLSPSMESFMSIRQNFTTSYAAMCIAQWILGIGDRHLGNTLISVESGRSLGIDFGSAFGGGVDQSVPELMPFRLTAQIRGLLKPFNENDLLGATMIHVLRALRNGKGPLLACLNVVAHEQLNWEEHVNKLSEDMQSEAVEIKWLPAKKVRIVSKKLNGAKPSTVTLEQLAERHSGKEYYFLRYTAIVNGTDSGDQSKRARMIQEDNLSPEEQVECLIEQATDPNVLGRAYVGWAPWL